MFQNERKTFRLSPVSMYRTDKWLDSLLGPAFAALENVLQTTSPFPKDCPNCVIGMVPLPMRMGLLQVSEIGEFGLTESMSGTQLRNLVVSIAKNGFENKVIQYVEIGGKKFVVNGNNRLIAAQILRRTGELSFQKVELPVAGFKTEADVITAHADVLSGIQ